MRGGEQMNKHGLRTKPDGNPSFMRWLLRGDYEDIGNADPQLLRNFESDQRSRARIWLEKLSLFGLGLSVFFCLVDYFTYPNEFLLFLILRFIAALFCLGVYSLNRRLELDHNANRLAIAMFYVLGGSFLIMLIKLGVYSTPYYAGLLVVIAAFGALYPFRVRALLFHCLAMYCLYIFCAMMNDPIDAFFADFMFAPEYAPSMKVFKLFIIHNAFLAAIIGIIVVSAAVSSNLRFRQYRLQQQLEEAKQELETSNQMLEITLVKKHRDLIENLEEKKLAEEMKDKLEAMLAQSQKMEAIGRLAGGVAHDFNNILAIIKVNTEMLLMRMDPENIHRKRVEQIHDASGRAANLIRQLLAFGRKQVLKQIPLNLNHIVRDIESMLKPLLGEDISLTYELDRQLNLITADPSQLEQVIMNLAVNARDAMPQGGRIHFKTSNIRFDPRHEGNDEFQVELSAGEYVMLSVSDEGEGMSEDVVSQIFEPFFTTKEPGKGTGLGLSTVYGIVKQSGGGVSVKSEPGAGTDFRVYFPATEKRESVSTEPKPSEAASGSETILIVEDEEMLRSLAAEILAEHGYQTIEAESPGKAMSIAVDRSQRIDLVLSDVVMPEMNGQALAERIMAMRESIQVMFMSGYSHDSLAQHGIDPKGDHFIGKPFTSSELLNAVRRVLDEAPSSEAH